MFMNMQEVFLPTLVHTNLIKITSLTCSTLLICRGDVGDLRKPYYGSGKYNDMIKTVVDSFGQLDCG